MFALSCCLFAFVCLQQSSRYCCYGQSQGFCYGKSNRNYEDPYNCYGFITCSNGRTFKTRCNYGLKYNKKMDRCDWPQNVQCGQDRWLKLNSGPVCFGARDDQFGRFYIPPGGGIIDAIKLVHQYGYVSCDTRDSTHWSYWGCANHGSVKQRISIAITTSANHILLPASQLSPDANLWTTIPGYNSLSPELVLRFLPHPRKMTSGQEWRLWYGEDFAGYTEEDNGGRVCCDVYAHFI